MECRQEYLLCNGCLTWKVLKMAHWEEKSTKWPNCVKVRVSHWFITVTMDSKRLNITLLSYGTGISKVMIISNGVSPQTITFTVPLRRWPTFVRWTSNLWQSWNFVRHVTGSRLADSARQPCLSYQVHENMLPKNMKGSKHCHILLYHKTLNLHVWTGTSG